LAPLLAAALDIPLPAGGRDTKRCVLSQPQGITRLCEGRGRHVTQSEHEPRV